jgi:hypothetical protein
VEDPQYGKKPWEEGYVFGQYTPSSYVEYSKTTFFRHEICITVGATLLDCIAFVEDWRSMADCFDLIDTVRGPHAS